MINLLLSKKIKQSETRLLIIDDNQIRYNEILRIFHKNSHTVKALLLDDIKSFEKQLNLQWDLVIFGRAYDIHIEQTLALMQAHATVGCPVLFLQPENYTMDQYQAYIHKGIYEIVDLADPELFYIQSVRALSFSRSLQSQHFLLADLENAKLKKQELVIEQNKAVAVIQEGIHVEANQEYLSLFGINSQEELIGLPILDILQPKQLNDFKSAYKKVSNGQFEFGRFDIETQNEQAKVKNPLKIEFMPGHEDDALQITIETESSKPAINIKAVEIPGQNTCHSAVKKLQRFLINHPANANALVLFSLANCPDEILNSDWNTFKAYFENLADFIQVQTNGIVVKIETTLYATVLQAASEDILKSRLTGLLALEKPQLVEINQQNFQQTVRLGYSLFNLSDLEADHFSSLVKQAYDTPLAKNTETCNISLIDLATPNSAIKQPIELALEPMLPRTKSSSMINPNSFKESPLLSQIQKALDKGEILLKYQQLYDKQDSNLNTYEVTSGIIYENLWTPLADLKELDLDPALSIKVDRWILVEACKHLHNFITEYPAAKLMINLNRHTLFNDSELAALIAKLITIVGSSEEWPIILQFNEEDIARNIIEAKKVINTLQQHGAQVSIRGFGQSISSENILREIQISCVKLATQYTSMLTQDSTLVTAQEKLDAFTAIQDVEFILSDLNDMSTFANAWNLSARMLQGDYFQKKLEHLIDVQDQ